MRRSHFARLLGAILLLGCLASGPSSHAQGGHHSHEKKYYGLTLSEWMKLYVTHYFLGGSDMVGKVKLMPLPTGDEVSLVSGSGTPDDPAVLVGKTKVTLKHGTPFVLTINFWYGELYEEGTSFPFNPDPPLPPGAWDLDSFIVKIDGKKIIDSRCDAEDYFAPYQKFDPRLSYSEPTPYGSIAVDNVEGYLFVHEPLSKGKHTLTLDVVQILPGNGFYANSPFGVGNHYKNTWTIKVE